MDCREELDFHDDSSRVVEKAKESILLMKKKMFRSHDLILQYNNKLKDFDRLKGELCATQDEATKLKRENNANHTKVVKLESQIVDYKKIQLDLENKIADQNVRIAGDKCHLEQLVCKLEELEDKHSGMLIEAGVQKSSLEGKIKELEQELRKLKKSQTAEAQKPERSVKPQRGRKSLAKNQTIEKETVDVGVNTTKERLPVITVKPDTAEKSIITDEFYHIKDNPYPIFCENCESLTSPSIEKFCKIMTYHPPLLGEMLSPPPLESTILGITNNLDEPAESIAKNESQEYRTVVPNLLCPEMENLKQKIAMLERKMKKRNRQASLESQRTSANCCGHSCPSNFCSSHATSHAANVPPAVPVNVQTDLMTEFWNRIMNFTNESSMKLNATRRKREKVGKKKSIKLNRQITKASMRRKRNKCVSSANWEIESDDCPNEIEEKNNAADANASVSHILRLKSSISDDARSARRSSSSDSVEKLSNRVKQMRKESSVRYSEQSKTSVRSGVRAKNDVLFNDDDGDENEDEDDDYDYDDDNDEPATKKTVEEMNFSKISQRRSSSRIHEKSLRSREIEKKMSLPVNETLSKSNSSTSENNPRDAESAYYSQNSVINESVEFSERHSLRASSIIDRSVSRSPSYDLPNARRDDYKDKSANSASNPSDGDLSGAPMEHYNDEETLEKISSSLADRGNTRKRKRASSPKTTKPTVRTKLLGKLRALKKNSIKISTKGSSQTSVEERSSRSLSRTGKISNESETECNENTTRNDPPIGNAAKRQRIAHVPKKSMSKERDVFQETHDVTVEERDLSPTTTTRTTKLQKDDEQTCKNIDEKLAENCLDAGTQEPVIRHLPLVKSSLNSSTCGDATNSLNISDLSLTRKIDGQIETLVNSSLTPTIPDTTKSRNVEIHSEERFNSFGNAPEANDFSKNDEIIEKCVNDVVEKVSNANSTETSKIAEDNRAKIKKTCQIPETMGQVASPTSIVAIAKTTIIHAPTIENTSTSSSFCTSKLPGSLRALASANILVPPITSRIDRHVVTNKDTIDDDDNTKSSSRSDKTRNTVEYNGDAINSTISESLVKPSKSIVQTRVSHDTLNISTNLEASSNESDDAHSSNDQTLGLFEKTPASPDLSPISHSSASCSDLKILPIKNSDDRSSIYDYVFPTASTSFDDNVASRANAAPRNLINYDTSMLEDYRENDVAEDDPRIIPKFLSNDTKNTRKNQNIVKDLRTRQVLCKTASAAASQQNNEKIMNPSNDDINNSSCAIDPAAYQRGIRCLGTLLTRHLAEVKRKNGLKVKKLRKAASIKLQVEAEKTVRTELNKLVESEEWTSVIHTRVIARLCQVSSRRTVAKSIVDFLIERADIGEPLDRTYTPPAPVMTRTQQRIAALINGLERDPSMSGVSELVRVGIEYNLFRLGYSIQFEAIEPLARMVTVIARMKKDRESVRILCFNALYFLGRKASTVIHVALSIWPEVFPAHGPNTGELVNCMVHLIRTEQSVKAASVKRLLKDYYKYPECQPQSSVLMVGYMKALTKKYTGELELSILLIAKREGTEWAYKHIVNGGLLKIIDDDNYQWPLNAISLLGFILRVFPMDDEDKTVSSTVDKLCEMLKSSQGSPDKEEGIVSALLSLSRHISNFDKIADSVLKWKPSRPMNYSTIEQINSFFKFRSLDWWNKRKQDKLKYSLEV